MSQSRVGQILGRVPNTQFFGREAEIERLCRAGKGDLSADADRPAADRPAPSFLRRFRVDPATINLVLGPPRVGKTEILLKCFDRLFTERGHAVPVYHRIEQRETGVVVFAREFLATFLTAFTAFRRNDPNRLFELPGPLPTLVRGAAAEDSGWIRRLVDAFDLATQLGDPVAMLKCALSAPRVAAANTGLVPVVMIDDFHLVVPAANADERAGFFWGQEVLGSLASRSPRRLAAYGNANWVLCGLGRVLVEMLPADEELFGLIRLFEVRPLSDEAFEQTIGAMATARSLEVGESTTELIVQQLNRDLFYAGSLLDAAAAFGRPLKTFMQFERVYTEEVTQGRIARFLDAVLRDAAGDPARLRASLEAMHMVTEAGEAAPREAILECMTRYTTGAEGLLAELHLRELLNSDFEFVRPSVDPVLADYVRVRYRREVSGLPPSLVGDPLLGRRLRLAYSLMMSRHNRAVESKLVDVLSRFDFQSIPTASFLSVRDSNSGLNDAASSDGEDETRIRLPQIVCVSDFGSSDVRGVAWRLVSARGFDGPIYNEENEVDWLVTLIRSKEPLDMETLNRICERQETAGQRGSADRSARAVRWFISKEGFSAAAAEHLSSLGAYGSNYAQLDLLSDHLTNLGQEHRNRKPATEFELVIPTDDEAELIAVRTVEQIARSAAFDQGAINQIKTALIEACINAAEHGDSPDGKIYQRFQIDDDRLVIRVWNKGRVFDPEVEGPARRERKAGMEQRGRGLQIIRALMDDVRFERTDDGTSLVMTKLLRRPPSVVES
jgi:serine/threonine-protein kinase RsbW